MTDNLIEAMGHIRALIGTTGSHNWITPHHEARAFLSRVEQSAAPPIQTVTEMAGEGPTMARGPAPDAAQGGLTGSFHTIIFSNPPDPAAELATPHAQLSNARAEAIERCAEIADAYAEENLRMAGDTVLHDPAFKPGPKDWAKSKDLMMQGCIHSAMFHASQNIASAIRSLKSKSEEEAP